MTPDVTLVVQSVLSGVFAANAHLLIGGLPAPGDNHMVDVDGVVAWPQHPLINPQEPPLKDQGFHQAYDMPDGEARDASETLISNPSVFTKEIRLRQDGV